MIMATLIISLIILTIKFAGAAPELAIIPLIPLSVLILINLSVYSEYNDKVGIVKAQSKVVKIYEDNVKELTVRLDSVKAKPTSIMNADNPAGALTVAITEAMTKLAESKEVKANAEIAIVQLNEGVFGYMVSKRTLELIE